jgi:tocopherol O-methyltransferase
MSRLAHQARVRRYYDENQVLYDLFWTDRESLSMSYGFWEAGTRRVKDALLNQQREIAARLEVGPADVVLDAGCGIGGACILLARERGARAFGITLSARQAALASRNAAQAGVSGRTAFLVADYLRSGFRDASFTRLFASESACYAESKPEFAREAFRLLAPGGRVVVADGFLARPGLAPEEQRLYFEWCDGWALSSLESVDGFRAALEAAGFVGVSFVERTREVMPSARRIRRIGRVALPIIRGLRRLRLVPEGQIAHAIACVRQHTVLERRIGVYGVFTAHKR